MGEAPPAPPASLPKIRFYVLQVMTVDRGPVSVVEGPYRSLPDSWVRAGELKARWPDKCFIAGDLCSAMQLFVLPA